MGKKKNRSCFIKLLLVIAIILALPARKTYAGGINSEERELIEVLSSDFVYEGITYRADPQYLKMAIDYLMRDDIDLTPEQKLKAFNEINLNVKTAVDRLYILPVPKETPTPTVEPTVTETPVEPEITETPTEPEPTTAPEVTKEPQVTATPTEMATVEKPVVTQAPTKPAPTKEPTVTPTKEPEKEVLVTVPAEEPEKDEKPTKEPTPESTPAVTEVVTPSIVPTPIINEPVKNVEGLNSASFSFVRIQKIATIFLIIAGGLVALSILLLCFKVRSKKRGKHLYGTLGITGATILVTILVIMTTTFCGAFLNQRSAILAAESGLIKQNYEYYQAQLANDLYGTNITAEAVNQELSWETYYLVNEQYLQSILLHNRTRDLAKEQLKKKEQLAIQLKSSYGADVQPNDDTLSVIAEKIVDHYYEFSLYESLLQIPDNQKAYGIKMAAGAFLCLLGTTLYLLLLKKNKMGGRKFLLKLGRICGFASILCVPASFLLTMQEKSSSTNGALCEFWNQYCQMLRVSMLLGAALLLLLGGIITVGIRYKDKREAMTE